jgi:site-specific DNA-methyltransferase (adenine-specific)
MLFWATKPVNGKKKHTFHYDAMRDENAGKQMKNVWRLGTPSNAEKRFGKHPTQKPVRLVARCLRASTNPGDLVFDPFAGSGTTGVAAISLDRRFCGVEIDEHFVDVAAKRLEEAATELRMPLD